MKIQLFDHSEFIDLNHLKEIKSPILFQRGNVPDPEGLISNDIFGVDVRSRKNTFAYIKLNGHFFHPHIYKTFKRFFRNIELIINGSYYYSLDENGYIVKDDAGETGLESIYKNWNKINWIRSEEKNSMRNERIDIITKSKKNEIFLEQYLVIPAFYRDILSDGSGGGETDELNTMYSRLIRYASLLETKDMFDFTLHSTNYNIQSLLVEIYDYFKTKLAKKNGMIRRFLMGKNVDYCTRSVITAPNFKAERAKDMQIDFEHAGIPISQVCSLCYPFMLKWLREFFDNEFIMNKETKIMAKGNEIVKLKDPEAIFNDDYIKKMMDRYIRNPECRFDPIMVELDNGEKHAVRFTGMMFDPNNPSEEDTIADRPLTITDVLYMAAVDICKDKHALITRYPLTDAYGLFTAKITVISTLQTMPVKINNTVYKNYPVINLKEQREKIVTLFIETVQFSHSYLEGINGDYDGDQVTIKIIWSHEANKEISEMMNNVSFYITPSGKNIRVIGKEPVQTMYTLTKGPVNTSKTVDQHIVNSIIELPIDDLTFSVIADLFARKKNSDRKFFPTDIVTIPANSQFKNKTPIKTTIGRLIFNRLVIESSNLIDSLGFYNEEIGGKGLKKLEGKITDLLLKNEITTEHMKAYINNRDFCGFKLTSILITPMTQNTLKLPKEAQKLKDELIKKYKKEIEDGNEVIAEKIEKELVAKTQEILRDDPGMDIYNSNSKNTVDNNLKNITIMRGAVFNPNTKKYDIVTSSLMDGMAKNEIPANSNTVVLGAYPKACGTADSGYLAKQLLAGMQSEIMDEDGSDCGTTKTISIWLDSSNIKQYLNRNVKVNGKPVLLTAENIDKFKDKFVQLYSPLYCTGKKLCSKCVGKYMNKFIGLDASKVATTLTNLNMKKFHDNVIKTTEISIDDIFVSKNNTNIFSIQKDTIVLNASYCEFYIPMFFFDKSYNFAEEQGKSISSIGLFYAGIFSNGKIQTIETLNIPVWIDIFANSKERREIPLPGLGTTDCVVIKYFKNDKIMNSHLVIDSDNAQTYLRLINFGKVPTSIPYSNVIQIWKKNQKLSDVNFGVNPVIEELILSVAYRYKDDPASKFSKVIGKPDSKVTEYDYNMASIRAICQYSSTFAAITFEDMDSMITSSINREREKKDETESPVEALFKL